MSDFSDGASHGTWRAPGGRFWTSDSYRAGYLLAQVPPEEMTALWQQVVLYGVMGLYVTAPLVAPILEFFGMSKSVYVGLATLFLVTFLLVELLKSASIRGRILFIVPAAFPYLYRSALPQYWPGDSALSFCEWFALGTLIYSLVRPERRKYSSRKISPGSSRGPAARRRFSASGEYLYAERD